MIVKKINIEMKENLESRPFAVLVQVASQYESSIYIQCDEKKVNAKSIMGMMALGLSSGEVTVSADGSDESKAMEEIEKYLETISA